MPTAKCFFIDVDARSLKKCGACGSVVSEAMGTVLCEFHFFRVSFIPYGGQGAVVVEGLSRAVVEGCTQVCVLAKVQRRI